MSLVRNCFYKCGNCGNIKLCVDFMIFECRYMVRHFSNYIWTGFLRLTGITLVLVVEMPMVYSDTSLYSDVDRPLKICLYSCE